MMCSDFRPTKRVSKKQPVVDWISELPDEVLVHTLSFLTLLDAARTSVLSKHWTSLWKNVPKLDFSDVNLWVRWLRCNRLRLPLGCEVKYVELFNKVLGSHRAIVLDEFRINFDLGDCFNVDVDDWLQYALWLDLNTSVCGIDLSISSFFRGPSYTIFPVLLGLSAGSASAVSPSISYLGLSTLWSLTLNGVNVSDSVVSFFLYNCPVLEDLVVGQSLALKHLEIVWCWGLISLIVCDINIVSLKVTNGEKLALKNVPNLVNVCVGGMYGAVEYSVGNSINWLSCCLSILVVITLHITSTQQEEGSNAIGGS